MVSRKKRDGFWRKFLSVPRAVFEIGAIGTAPFLLLDYSVIGGSVPDWKGPIAQLNWFLPVIFTVSVVGLGLNVLAQYLEGEFISHLRRKAERAQELENLIATNIREIIEGILNGFGKQVRLTDDDQTRISLYVKADANKLANIGRVSTNPNFGEIGRRTIPIEQGCVGAAWAGGWSYVKDFGEDDNFVSNQENSGISVEILNALNMKPRFLAALRIADAHGRPLAVMVVESLQEERFEETKIKSEMNKFSKLLERSILAIRPHIPKIATSIEEEL